MFNRQPFVNCVLEQAERFRFGDKRTKDILDRYNGLAEGYRAAGLGDVDAEVRAMGRVFDEVANETAEKAKRAMATFVKVGEVKKRFEGIENVITNSITGAKDVGEAAGHAAMSFLEDDPRFPGVSYHDTKDAVRGAIWATANDVAEKMGKGLMGTQRATAHMPNVVKELFGVDTGDQAAKVIATAWRKGTDAGVDLFNQAGGSLRKLADWRLPQATSKARLLEAGEEEFIRFHMDALDWSKMRRPDGSPIPNSTAERAKVLADVFDTLTTDGISKKTATGGRGGSVGNQVDKHRFLVYKDADAWLAHHAKYGDGNLFDVMAGHIEHLAHETALVQTFGPNPEQMLATVKLYALKTAKEKGGAKAKDKAEAILKNKFSPMFDVVMRSNPMDPESVTGHLVTNVASLIRAAQLGSASILAVPGDFMTSAAVKKLNGMNVFGGVDMYIKSIATDREFMRQIAAQSGFVMDESVASNYAAARYFGETLSQGSAIAARISDSVMRLSGLAGHTKAARWQAQTEFMGMMSRDMGKSFDDLPYKDMMARYGIGAKEWDAFRQNVKPWTPRQDVNFLRPIDLLQTNLKNKTDLYRAFQGMIFAETKRMVPEATLEGQVSLRGTTRPDTLHGAVLYSFSMYKNFPVSMQMIYGRLAATRPDATGRLGWIAGLVAGLTMVGALGTQLRELTKGREPLPMDNPAFLGKAMLAGGGLGIWGDFLFSGVNQRSGTTSETFAGPLAQFLGDTSNLLAGDAFEWAANMGSLGEKGAKFPSKGVEYLKRYTPGSSLWWARLAVERQVFDRLQELADPQAYQKFRRKVQTQKREYGNDYWWAPGDKTPR